MSGLHTRSHTSRSSPGAGRRAPGCWIGFVTKIDDDRKLARVKVRIPDLSGQRETDWARVVAPVGGIRSGGVLVPPVGAAVLVLFEQEETNKPIVLGGIWFQEAEESQAPLAARGETDEVRNGPRGVDVATGAGGAALQEPADPFAAKYPTNIVFKAPGAEHLIELDTTEGAERISITHGTSKTWIEMHPNGDLVIGVKGKRYVVVDLDSQTHIKANQDTVVDGNSSHLTAGNQELSVGGNKNEVIGGNETKTVGGNQTETVGGNQTSTAAQYQIVSLGNWFLQAAGIASITALSLALQITTAYLVNCVNYTLNASAAINMVTAAFTALVSGVTTIGPGQEPGPVVTTITHPFDFITGLPIQGSPQVLVG